MGSVYIGAMDIPEKVLKSIELSQNYQQHAVGTFSCIADVNGTDSYHMITSGLIWALNTSLNIASFWNDFYNKSFIELVTDCTGTQLSVFESRRGFLNTGNICFNQKTESTLKYPYTVLCELCAVITKNFRGEVL